MQDCELLAEDLERLVKSYKSVVHLELGEEFPEDPKEQLWGAVGAVFNSWMNQRAKTYRRSGVDIFYEKTTKKECAKKYDKLLTFNIIVLIVRVRSCEINSGSWIIAWI